MTQRSSAHVLAGGLDEITPPLVVPKGRVIGCKNHEAVSDGYARSGGFERFDGRTPPSTAYTVAGIDGSITAREAARAAIGPVPGSGPVRGVAAFRGEKYAWRDSADGTVGVMHRATPAGWTPVQLGAELAFTSGNAEPLPGSTLTGATSGATGIVKRVVTTSGGWQSGDAAGYIVLAATTGSFQSESVNGATLDMLTASGAAGAQGWPPGGRYLTSNHNFYGSSALKQMYGCNGVGPGFAFDGDVVTFIYTGMPIDAPNRIAIYKQQLFFSFPGGSVQHSQIGEPLLWSARLGAGEIGVGSDVTDLLVTTDALHIFTIDSVNTLVGNDETDFVLQPLATEEGQGALPFTAQKVGVPMYLDVGGFRSITTTNAYGNFRLGALTPQIQPTLGSKRRGGRMAVASCVVKGKDQYRLFFADQTGVTVYFGRKYPEPMLFDLPIQVTCVTVELNAASGERIFAGATNGFVYEMDSGSSYDGEEIVAYLQLPWDNEGSSDVLKRWHKATLELSAEPNTLIGVLAEFDYADGEQRVAPMALFNVAGGGGLWNTVDWNQFFWSAPAEGKAECYLDGQGENMSLTIVSRSTEQLPYVLSALRKKISIRGQKR